MGSQPDLFQASPAAKLPPTDRKRLWKDGLTDLIRLTALPKAAARSLLGRLEAITERDSLALLGIIADGLRQKPDRAVPWVIACARQLAGKDREADPWGLAEWYQAAPESVQDWPTDELATILAAARLPTSWRGTMAPLEGWLQDGYRPDSIAEVVARVTNTREASSLAYFNAPVRKEALRWDVASCEWRRHERGREAYR